MDVEGFVGSEEEEGEGRMFLNEGGGVGRYKETARAGVENDLY